MSRDDFREALLRLMGRRVHWAWPQFTSARARLAYRAEVAAACGLDRGA